MWGSVGVTSIPAPSPFFRDKPKNTSDIAWWARKVLFGAFSLAAVVLAVIAMFAMNMVPTPCNATHVKLRVRRNFPWVSLLII